MILASVTWSVKRAGSAKTAERIDLLFGVETPGHDKGREFNAAFADPALLDFNPSSILDFVLGQRFDHYECGRLSWLGQLYGALSYSFTYLLTYLYYFGQMFDKISLMVCHKQNN